MFILLQFAYVYIAVAYSVTNWSNLSVWTIQNVYMYNIGSSTHYGFANHSEVRSVNKIQILFFILFHK